MNATWQTSMESHVRTVKEMYRCVTPNRNSSLLLHVLSCAIGNCIKSPTDIWPCDGTYHIQGSFRLPSVPQSCSFTVLSVVHRIEVFFSIHDAWGCVWLAPGGENKKDVSGVNLEVVCACAVQVCVCVCVLNSHVKYEIQRSKWGEVDWIHSNGEKSLNEANTGSCIFINDCLTRPQG